MMSHSESNWDKPSVLLPLTHGCVWDILPSALPCFLHMALTEKSVQLMAECVCLPAGHSAQSEANNGHCMDL